MKPIGTGPVVIVLVLALLGGGCTAGGDEERFAGRTDREGAAARFPRNDLSLIFISIDTCRPDRIGCYGNGAIETPAIDALAAAGTRFDRAVTSVPLTLPAHATFFTSQYPYRHRIRNNGHYALSRNRTTLAEVLKEEGYRTAAVLGSFPLDSRFGLAQGFDHYDDRFPPRNADDIHDVTERTAEDVVNRAIEWLSGNRNDKTFLFVHLFDPHWRYEAPEPFRSRYGNSPYEAEIAYVDSEIGRLLEALELFGVRDNTVIVLAGDHGESLGEHGEETHGIFVYQSTVSIPLIISWPDRTEFEEAPLLRGKVVASQVRGIDLAPTMLDLLGLRSLEDAEGTSLVPLMVAPDLSLDLIHYAESFSPREDYGWSEVRSLSTDEWKYILLPSEELYRLTDDPGERSNLILEFPGKAAEFRALLEERIAEDNRRADEAATLEIDEESRRKLAALGYITSPRKSAAGAGDNDGRPDPKGRIDLLGRFFQARALQGRGKQEDALVIYEELEKADPHNPEILKALAEIYLLLGHLDSVDTALRKGEAIAPHDLHLMGTTASLHQARKQYGKAISVLEEMLSRDPQFEGGHLQLGRIFLLSGNIARAREEFEAELALYPESPAALNDLGKVHETTGQVDEAFVYYRKAIESRADFGEGYYNLANIYSRRGNTEQALVHLRRAIEYDPEMVEAYYNLAVLAKKLGRRRESFALLRKSVEVKPSFAKGHYGIGNYYREAGKFEEAIHEYEIARRFSPEDPDVLLNFGIALAGLNRYAEAIEIWETAGRIAPGTESGQSARENARLARSQIGDF